MPLRALLVSLLCLIVAVIVYTQFTLFVVPRIGAIPEGRTVVLLRYGKNADGQWVKVKTKFIDSADAMCKREMGGVNLLCRGMVMAAVASSSTIIVRLPYSQTLEQLAEGG